MNLFPYAATNNFHIVPHRIKRAYYGVSQEREETKMAFGNVDGAACGCGKGIGTGIAAVVVIILLLIAMGIVF